MSRDTYLLVDRSGQPIAEDLAKILARWRRGLQQQYPEFLDECVLDEFLERCAESIERSRSRGHVRSLRAVAYFVVRREAAYQRRPWRGGHADQLIERIADGVDLSRIHAVHGSAVEIEDRALCAEYLATLTPEERHAILAWLDRGYGDRLGGRVKRLGRQALAKLQALGGSKRALRRVLPTGDGG